MKDPSCRKFTLGVGLAFMICALLGGVVPWQITWLYMLVCGFLFLATVAFILLCKDLVARLLALVELVVGGMVLLSGIC